MRVASLPRIFAGLVLGTAAVTLHAGEVLDRIQKTGKLTIAYRESSVPFSYLDGERRPVGYAVDICRHLAEAVRTKLGMKTLDIDYVLVTPSNRLAAIVEGHADLECGSTTNNAERRKQVAFTVPHYITGSRFLVRANSGIKDLRGFEGKTLVSTKGTTPLRAIEQVNQERLLGIKVVEAPDHVSAFDMVALGRADGFVMDDVLLYGLVAAQKDPSKFKVVGKFLTIEALAIMLSKNDSIFKKIIDDEMKRMIHAREMHGLYERWFMKPIPPRNAMLSLPMSYLLKDLWKYPSDVVPF
jgi:glutamate/aspartate transport system substrate-binding protein